MPKQPKMRNFPESSKAPLAEEQTDDIIPAQEEQQIEEQLRNQSFAVEERRAFEQRLLDMEAIVRAVVHENATLQARIQGLELEKTQDQIPDNRCEIIQSPRNPENITKKNKEVVRPPKPPVKQITPVGSSEGSSSTRSVNSKAVNHHKRQRPNDAQHHPEATANSKSNRVSVFERLGAEKGKKNQKSVRSNSNTRVLGNKAPLFEIEKKTLLKDNASAPPLQEVNAMLSRILQLKSNLEAGGQISVGNPFVEEIQKEVLPLNVRQPHLEQYEGLSDPEDHMAYFMNTLQLHNFSDAILCKLFSASLKGVARAWFNQLPAKSISCFTQLAAQFRAHFMTNRKTERDYAYLFTIKQKKDESLKDYIIRFNRAKLEVPGVDSKVAAAAAVQGLLVDSSFYLSISKSKFTTMEQFTAKADKYILQEENLAARKGNGEKKDDERAENSKQRDRRNYSSNQNDDYQDRGYKKNRGRYHQYPMYKDFTALSKPLQHIFNVAERKGILPPPVPMKTGGGRRFNNDEFCDYHKQKGHSTKNCYQLKNAIEDAIRRGWLKEFIDKNGQCKEERPKRKRKEEEDDDEDDTCHDDRSAQKENKPLARADRDRNCPGVVHTIVGGPPVTNCNATSAGASTSASGKGKQVCHVETKRRKVDNIIVFTDEDFEGVETPHQDALVILVRLAGWKVERVMIDTGSSADILFNSCYEQIRPTLKQNLKPYNHELFGFDGRPVRPRGVIKLPLQLGDGDNYVTKETEFVVVDCFSPYNAILGRNTIWRFDMSISMPRLKAKFPTPTGVGVCAGDQ